MNSRTLSRPAALALLLWGTQAFGAFSTPHYLGFSRDGSEFRIYLSAGEFVGRAGSLQAVRVTVHQLRQGRLRRALQGCVYHFDDTDHRQDRIDCPEGTAGPLRGLAYAREAQRPGLQAPGLEGLVCVRRCSRQAPHRLHLEETDEDNG